MTREIKFRGFHKHINVMEYYDTVAFLNFEEDVLCYQNSPQNEPHGFSDTSDVEIMQFTGLKDKNGKDIYEGDILSVDEYYQESNGGMPYEIVYWEEYYTGFSPLYRDYTRPDELEIIGNIYENPELLEEEE